MFPAVATKTRTAERNLYLVWSRQEAREDNKGETKMKTYKFAGYPSNSSVAAGVTVLVSVWFLVAGAVMLTDPSSPYTTRKVEPDAVAMKTAEAKVPRFTETIYVSASAPQVYDTIYVSAKRPSNRTAT